MSPPPIPSRWDGESWTPLPGFAKAADEHYVIGEVYPMAPVEERSEVSHRQEFAWLREAWQTLPDHLSGEYRSPEHLRKRALIATGWCTVQDYPCSSRAEAARWAVNLQREVDEYTVILVSEAVVRVYRARSQARNAMGKADFQASKTAILEWVAALIEIDPQQLSKSGQVAGGVNNPAREAA